MLFRHKISTYIICVLLLAWPLYSETFFGMIRNFFSFKLPADVFASVNQNIIGKLKARDIRFVLPNKIEIDGMEVEDDQGKRVLYGEHVTMSISLLSLLTSNITITDAYVDSPFFYYTISDGVHNIVRVFESPPGTEDSDDTSDLRVTIKHVRVDNGRYQMFHDAGVKISAEGISAEGMFYVEDGPFGIDIEKVSIERGDIKTSGMDLPITQLVSHRLWISDQEVSTDDLIATYETAKIAGKGMVHIGREYYDLQATIDAEKGTYPSGLKPLPFVVPAFKADVTMNGDLVDPRFKVDMDFTETSFDTLQIKQGKVKSTFDQHLITVDSFAIQLGEQGGVNGNGAVDLDDQSFNFSTSEKRVALEDLAGFFAPEQAAKGDLSGESKITGSFNDSQPKVHIISQGKILEGKSKDFSLSETTNYDFDLTWFLEKNVWLKKIRFFDAEGLSLDVSGNYDLNDGAFSSKFALLCPHLGDYWTHMPSDGRADGIELRGTLVKSKGAMSLISRLQSNLLEYQGLAANNLTSNILLSKGRLHIDNLSADFLRGGLDGSLKIMDLYGEQNIEGTARIDGLDLSLLPRKHLDAELSGRLYSELKLAGSLKKPFIIFNGEGEGINVQNISLGDSQFDGQYVADRLNIFNLKSFVRPGVINGKNIFLDFSSKKIFGDLTLTDISIGSTFTDFEGIVGGDLDGPIYIEGSIDKPRIYAPLKVENFTFYGVKFGGGAFSVDLSERQLLNASSTDLVFSISANLSENERNNLGRVAIALNNKTINAKVKLDGIELNSQDVGFFPKKFGWVGSVNGELSIDGPIKSPRLDSHIIVDRYGFFTPGVRKRLSEIKKLHGPLVIKTKSRSGELDLDLCASLLAPTDEFECESKPAISLQLKGPFSLEEFALDFKGQLDYENFEEAILFLRSELVSLDAAAIFSGHIAKTKTSSPSYRATVSMDRLTVSMPNVKRVALKDPIKIALSNEGIKLLNEARLLFSPGELSVLGSYVSSSVDLKLEGAIPLVLSRLFVPMIQRADGLASGKIKLSGSPGRLIPSGSIVPQTGAIISFRKYLDPIEIKKGAISFTKTSEKSFVAKFEDIDLSVGDGKAHFKGSFSKRYAQKDKPNSSTFAIALNGNGIVVRDGLNFVETDLRIDTQQHRDGSSTVAGEIIVTDGSAHRQFDLRNFVAQAQTGFDLSLQRSLENIDMGVDLDLAVREFRASASMLNLDIDTSLRGQMRIKGPIAHPKLTGSIFINDGAIIFPAMSFDLMGNHISLDENSSRIFDPKINIVATQEMEREDFPQIDKDTTIELSLRGNLDKLNLEFRPLRGDMRLSQLKIFMLLLSPRGMAGFESGDELAMIKQGAQNAAMALSGEVFLRPLTNELQELLEGKTKTRFQFGSTLEPGGFTVRLNWKLSPRMELQGSYLFFGKDIRSHSADKSALDIDTSYPLGDLKLKLLLFDHRPLGPLFLESSIGSVRQMNREEEARAKIRLTYRVLSK